MTTSDISRAPRPTDDAVEALGRRAAALFDDPALTEAFARLERDIVAAWRSSPIDQAQAREWLYLRTSALNAVRDELKLMVEQGALAERERLRHQQAAAERRAAGYAAGDPP